MAAKQWAVDAASLTTADGKVTNPAGKLSLTYGQLTRGEQIVTTVSSSAPLTPAKDWKVAGTAIPKASGREFVTGKHKYPSDISLPGMMFGKVLRATGFNATLVSIDTSAAEKLPGVKLVRDGDFIGVVAPDAYTAEQAISFIQAKWTVPSQPSNQNIFEYLKNNLEAGARRRRLSPQRSSPARRCRIHAALGLHRDSARATIHRAIHRARSTGTARRCGPLGLHRQADRMDGHPAAIWRQG